MAEPDGEVAPPPETPRPNWPVRLAFGGLCLLVVALTAVSTLLWLRVDDAATEEASRQAALQAARQVAVNLTTVSKDTAQQDLDRLLDSVTGTFRDHFADLSSAFRKVLQEADVVSQGTVREAGVSSVDEDSAEVLAAVTATVRNTDAPSGEQRQYRMRLRLNREGERWLVSDLQFVP